MEDDSNSNSTAPKSIFFICADGLDSPPTPNHPRFPKIKASREELAALLDLLKRRRDALLSGDCAHVCPSRDGDHHRPRALVHPHGLLKMNPRANNATSYRYHPYHEVPVSGSNSASETTVTDPIVHGAVKDDSDDDDVSSKTNANLDLELRLGFGV